MPKQATRRPARKSNSDEVPEHIQILEDAVLAVENDETFRAWLDFRAEFYRYSWRNSLMILKQYPQATVVAGYRDWQNKHDRQVRKGEKGIIILAPLVKKREKEDPKTGEKSNVRALVGFRGARVFDISQTEGEGEIPAQPQRASITGESHAKFIAPLIAHATSLGYTVEYEDLNNCEGYCQESKKKIAIQKSAPANAQLRILIHELVHAHGTSYEKFGRKLAETITDSATYVACRSIGLDVTQVVAEYVAGWSDPELRKQALAYIDFYACAIERALGLHDRSPALPPDVDANPTSVAAIAAPEAIAA